MNASGLLLTVLGIGACLLFIAWRAKVQLRLFVISVESGQIVAVKGRIPQRLLSDIADVIRMEARGRLRIVCRIEDGAARTMVYGDANPGFEQMLRNLVGEYPLLRLKQAARVKGR